MSITDQIKSWKQQIAQEFFKGSCSEHNCGHDHITKLFVWEETIGYTSHSEIDYERKHQTYEFGLCSICFSFGLVHFMNQHSHVPYLNGEGRDFTQYIKTLRKTISEEKLLKFVWSDAFLAIDAIVFDTYEPLARNESLSISYDTIFVSYFHNKYRYHEMLAKAGVIDIVSNGELAFLKLCDSSIVRMCKLEQEMRNLVGDMHVFRKQLAFL